MMESFSQSLDWYEETACLLTKCLVASLVPLDDIVPAADGPTADVAVFAQSLAPDQLIGLIATRQVSALILQKGSLADHTAGIANARGIQLVIAPQMTNVPRGSFVLIDGANERLSLGPHQGILSDICSNLQPKTILGPITSKDEKFFATVLVDGSKPSELFSGLAQGAAGVGILRSEWLGWSDETFPKADTLLAHYKEAALTVLPHRLNIRLFDIGGDKIPRWCEPYADLLQSPLGFRGIRAAAYLHEAFKSQFIAISECARSYPIGVVIPMVTDAIDIHEAKLLLSKYATSQQMQNISIGAMIEVPSIALRVSEAIKDIDFVRIGPGDLSQFTLAKLRKNISPKEFSGRGFHPAVLDLIEHVSQICNEEGKDVTICLDIEPRVSLIESLLARGIRKFTASPLAIHSVLARIREVMAVQYHR
jgi:phosphoenolpyruvate-protein kinase (PTS system EI component)